MPRHDRVPRSYRRAAAAWSHYKRVMSWMAIAAAVAVLFSLIYLKSQGEPVPIHMMIATIAGVGFTALLGTGLMGFFYFSNNSGHDDFAGGRDDEDDRP